MSAPQLALDFTAPATGRLRHAHAPYQLGSETSRDAAEQAAPRAHTTAMRVLRYVIARGPADGATRPEVEAAVPVKGRRMPTGTACARLNWLQENGYVRKLTVLEGEPGSYHEKVIKRDGCAVYVWTGKDPEDEG